MPGTLPVSVLCHDWGVESRNSNVEACRRIADNLCPYRTKTSDGYPRQQVLRA